MVVRTQKQTRCKQKYVLFTSAEALGPLMRPLGHTPLILLVYVWGRKRCGKVLKEGESTIASGSAPLPFSTSQFLPRNAQILLLPAHGLPPSPTYQHWWIQAGCWCSPGKAHHFLQWPSSALWGVLMWRCWAFEMLLSQAALLECLQLHAFTFLPLK